VETDQESSLVQAISRYVRATGDRALLQGEIGGERVVRRLEAALEYLLKDRFDAERGLLWGATTVDWGDVQPEHEWGVVLDESSHLAIDIYDNALFVVAIGCFLELLEDDPERASAWAARRDEIKKGIRTHLWDGEKQKFVPHIYLEGSPFPEDFDESEIWYHGGTAVAIEAGVLSRDEVRASLERMARNVREAGASSIGLTVHPPYPKGFFKNPSMAPWSYQNGGDWCWFGGRMVQQLIRYGFIDQAYRELKPMVSRVLKHDGFYEWWTRDNQPRGSGEFRGSAGVLGRAIEMLLAWAEKQGATSAQSPSE
jgi:glycogen debranching enzyme